MTAGRERRVNDEGASRRITNDQTIGELGAYGVTYYMHVWIGSHWPAASQSERDYALNRAERLRLSGAFCEFCQKSPQGP